MPAPPFGSASAYADAFPSAPPQQLTVAAETCFNLSVFKDVLRQYRKLDDQVITRLNRASAQLRDLSRGAPSSSRSPSPGAEDMCVRLWAEMMTGWSHRQTLLGYCQRTVHASVAEKRARVAGIEERLSATPLSQQASIMSSLESTPPSSAQVSVSSRGWKEDEVVSDQLDNETTIEAIIRKRTLDAFKSRCPFFSPADAAGRAWWEVADSGRKGQGPEV